eukprot:699657-Amphidinium_carterae.1
MACVINPLPYYVWARDHLRFARLCLGAVPLRHTLGARQGALNCRRAAESVCHSIAELLHAHPQVTRLSFSITLIGIHRSDRTAAAADAHSVEVCPRHVTP